MRLSKRQHEPRFRGLARRLSWFRFSSSRPRRATSGPNGSFDAKRAARCACTGLAAACFGCGQTGQGPANVSLFLGGVDVSEPVAAVGGVTLEIERADLAFGPLYLCAGTSAGQLCDTARLEWLESSVVDTTDPSFVDAGDLVGVTGAVRSWMYDLGISSQLTRDDPFVLDAARQLGNSSFVVEGRALVGDVSIPFRASVPVQQSDDTERGVPVVRKSVAEPFFVEVGEREAALFVRFDSRAWLAELDFRPFAASESCESAGAPLVCAGRVERTCGEEGVELSERDCGELGAVCLPRRGCEEALTLGPDTDAFRQLRNALVVGSRPTFEWQAEP